MERSAQHGGLECRQGKRYACVLLDLFSILGSIKYQRIPGYFIEMDHRRTGGRLTDSSVKSLKPRARSYDITDPATPGLQLRAHPSGLKTWYYRYGRPDGKKDRFRLGYYPAMSLTIARRPPQATRASAIASRARTVQARITDIKGNTALNEGREVPQAPVKLGRAQRGGSGRHAAAIEVGRVRRHAGAAWGIAT